MVSEMINVPEVEELLRQMQDLSCRLPDYTMSAAGRVSEDGAPSATTTVLRLAQCLLERLVALQGELVRELAADTPAKRRPGRPRGSQNKPKQAQDLPVAGPTPVSQSPTEADGTMPGPTPPDGMAGEWVGKIFVPKLVSAHGKVPCVPGGKVCP